MPNYMIAQSDNAVVLRNFEGFITTYEQPTNYTRPAKSLTDPYKDLGNEGQEGVLGLLQGKQVSIKPEGFDQLRGRGGVKHRLRADESKWKALGKGDQSQN